MSFTIKCESCGALANVPTVADLRALSEQIVAAHASDASGRPLPPSVAIAEATAILGGVGAPLVNAEARADVVGQLAQRLEASEATPGKQPPVATGLTPVQAVALGQPQQPYQPTGAGITGQAALDAHAAAIAASVAKRNE